MEKAKILSLSIQKMTAKILSTFMDSHWILYQMKRRYNIIDCGYKGQEVIGDFPILVCSSQVELILKQYPEAVQEVDKQGLLPLHIACQRRAAKDIIELILNQYPEAVQKVDKYERLPLQLACRSKASKDTMQF